MLTEYETRLMIREEIAKALEQVAGRAYAVRIEVALANTAKQLREMAAAAVRAQLADGLSDNELAQVYLDARAVEDARSRQDGLVRPHAAGLRAVASAVRERMGLPPE